MEIGTKLKVININPLEGNSIAPPLKLEEIKELAEIYTCKCGQNHYHVGLASKYTYVRCYKCKVELPEGDVKHWCHPSRFSNPESL